MSGDSRGARGRTGIIGVACGLLLSPLASLAHEDDFFAFSAVNGDSSWSRPVGRRGTRSPDIAHHTREYYPFKTGE